MGKRNRDLDLRVVSVCVSKSLNFLSYFLALSFSFFLLLLPLATIVMQCERCSFWFGSVSVFEFSDTK